MATTDARTGFRLPWSTDQRQPSDGDAVSVEDRDAMAADTRAFASAEAAVEGEAAADPETPAPELAIESTTEHAAPEAPMSPAPSRAPSGGSRKPNKFLADLTKAMHAAAQSAREESLARFQADAKAYVEQVHARSAEGATELRKTADDDIAAIRDWSKAEIARIREETEQRITERKGRLEYEIEDHAAQIEREIERIQGRVAAFETEMERFFERLLGEEDPTRFASMAQSLPEPPSFEDDGDGWMPVPSEAVISDDLTTDAPADVPADVSAEMTAEGDAWAAAGWSSPDGATAGTAGAAVDGAAAVDEVASDAALSPQDQEAAFAAIQAAAEEAAARELLEGEPVETDTAADSAAADAHDGADSSLDDLRLSALGLAADSAAAAEAEAFAAVDASSTEVEEIPEIADDALAARLAGLVPNDEPAQAEASHTQVVVTGLVSVASIASFKRHVGRLAGVQSVGVSSGPDGEFVFAVAHSPEVSLADAIPTLPGFGARVTGTADGTVNVTARDPEADA